MERNELKGRQTPGKITSGQSVEWSEESGGTISLNAPNWSGLAHVYQHLLKKKYKKEGEANAALYAEAHNVANDTGMWPLDMVERIKELEDALQRLLHTTPWFRLRKEELERALAILNKKV